MNTFQRVVTKMNLMVSVSTRLLSTFTNESSLSVPKFVPHIYHQIPNVVKKKQNENLSSLSSKDKICPSILDKFFLDYQVPIADKSAFEKENEVIGDRPVSNDKNGIKANKQDLYWRRRKMRRHRLLRWRQLHKKLYLQQIARKEKSRNMKHKRELKQEWAKLGLKKEPPKLTENEKSELVKNWMEQKLWKETLTEAELREFMRVQVIRRRTDKK